jgi:hypothetical protein
MKRAPFLESRRNGRNLYFLDCIYELDDEGGGYHALFASRFQAKKRAKYLARRVFELRAVRIRRAVQRDLVLTGWTIRTHRKPPTLADLYAMATL